MAGDEDADKGKVELELIAEGPEDRDQLTVAEDVLQIRQVRKQLRHGGRRGAQRREEGKAAVNEQHLERDGRPVWGVEPDRAAQHESAEVARRHRPVADGSGNDEAAEDKEDVDAEVTTFGEPAQRAGEPGLRAAAEGPLHVIENHGECGQAAHGVHGLEPVGLGRTFTARHRHP